MDRKLSTLLKVAVVMAIMMCLCVSIAAANAYASEGAGTVTASALNIRSGPNTSSSVVSCVPRGTVLLVNDTASGWYKVWYQGSEGYVRADYISFSASADANFGTGTVKGTGVRVRSGPGTGYSILGTVNSGASMSVTGVNGNWYRVSYNGYTGYVRSDYMTVSAGSAPAQSQTGTSQPAQNREGAIKGYGVRLRSGPGTGYSILGTYSSGTKLTVTGESGDWYAVTVGGVKGYVNKPYVTLSGTSGGTGTSSGTAAWTTTAVNMRSGPGTGYAVQRVLSRGAKVTVTGQSGSWKKVSYNGAEGYVRQDYLTSTEPSQSTPAASGNGQRIVTEAKKYLGVRYVYGGTSPSGFDCSGFVYYVYRMCGYSIARTATAQNSMGSYVSRSDLAPGDILIFYNSAVTAIGHAGIYIGNGQFIHASSGNGRVLISSLSESYYNTRYYSARRVA